MAEVKEFNYNKDKITEREVVFDFVERLSTGKDIVIEDYDITAFPDDKEILIDKNTKVVKILEYLLESLPKDVLHNISKLKCGNIVIPKGMDTITILIPKNYNLYKVIQNSTGFNITECFIKVDSPYDYDKYTVTFDEPCEEDIIKVYYI